MSGFNIALILAVIAQAASPSPSIASPEKARNAVATCGVSKSSVKVLYRRDMDEDVVWVSRQQQPLAEPALECIARASIDTIYYVYFRDPAEQQRYWAVYDRVTNTASIAAAREWLNERDLLSTLPLPADGKPVSEYAQSVERFCGVRPGALLKAVDDHMITFAEGGLGKVTEAGIVDAVATTEQFNCVTNVIAAADLRSHELFFGFIAKAAPDQH